MKIKHKRRPLYNRNHLVCGWGVNDTGRNTDYYILIDGEKKRRKCHYYEDWRRILRSCFDKDFQRKQPTYKGCTVHEDWKYFSNFIKWVDSQPNKDWKNCHLDKDLLKVDNKKYSPDNCVYIPQALNKFLTGRAGRRGDCMIGVSFLSNRKVRKYHSSCRDHSTNKSKYLGFFETELAAHLAWQARKHELACQLAELQSDPRVAKALRERYSPDKDWTKA